MKTDSLAYTSYDNGTGSYTCGIESGNNGIQTYKLVIASNRNGIATDRKGTPTHKTYNSKLYKPNSLIINLKY